VEIAVTAGFGDLVLFVEGVHPTPKGKVLPLEAPGPIRWINARSKSGQDGKIAAAMPTTDPFSPGHLLENVFPVKGEVVPSTNEPIYGGDFISKDL